MTSHELEAMALRHVADCGVVPYWIWAALDGPALERIGALTIDSARVQLAAPAITRAVTPRLEPARIAEIVAAANAAG